MGTSLDEDFVNFEAVSQNCGLLLATTDEELNLLDNEARQRERNCQGDKKINEKNNNVVLIGRKKEEKGKMKTPCPNNEDGDNRSSPPMPDHLFTTFSYNSTSKRLTMIPVKYKIKEERRKVLKISINKLKKIDDPESWLCRSVLINNTMKKLQKEARDEKLQKQMNTYSKGYFMKSTNNCDDFSCQLNNNNQNFSEDICPKPSEQDCFYQKDFSNEEKDDVFCQIANSKSDFDYQTNKENEKDDGDKCNAKKGSKLLKMSSVDEAEDISISNGVPLNEDFVEKIPSIKRCASRKRSLDEDGTASEILNLNDTDLDISCNRKRTELDDVDECDVHDVLSQLYMPPTPRMLTSMDVDAEDELNVVDIDSSFIDNIKTNECQNKLPNETSNSDSSSSSSIYESDMLPDPGNLVVSLDKEAVVSAAESGKRQSDDYQVESNCVNNNNSSNNNNNNNNNNTNNKNNNNINNNNNNSGSNNNKKRKLNDDIFSCFNECETNFLTNDFGKKENFDNFLCGNNRSKETDRTSLDFSGRMDQKESFVVKNQEDDELIELEDEEDIKRRLSQSLSNYHRKTEKNCDNFFEDGCDNQYSCGHTVTMFNDIQSVTFHNLIASLET